MMTDEEKVKLLIAQQASEKIVRQLLTAYSTAVEKVAEAADSYVAAQDNATSGAARDSAIAQTNYYYLVDCVDDMRKKYRALKDPNKAIKGED